MDLIFNLAKKGQRTQDRMKISLFFWIQKNAEKQTIHSFVLPSSAIEDMWWKKNLRRIFYREKVECGITHKKQFKGYIDGKLPSSNHGSDLQDCSPFFVRKLGFLETIFIVKRSQKLLFVRCIQK